MTRTALAQAYEALTAACRVLASDGEDPPSIWEILDDSDDADELEGVLGAHPKLRVNFLRRTLEDTYVVTDDEGEKRVVEWDGSGYASVYKPESWLEGADSIVGLIQDKLAEEFDKDFHAHPGKLYHATTRENAEQIMEQGLNAADKTRGLTNRGVGHAIFTTDELDLAQGGSYGDTVIEIDMAGAKKAGIRFNVAQEPSVVEREAMGVLASALELDDYEYEAMSDGADDPSTVIVHAQNIPPKFLRVVD